MILKRRSKLITLGVRPQNMDPDSGGEQSPPWSNWEGDDYNRRTKTSTLRGGQADSPDAIRKLQGLDVCVHLCMDAPILYLCSFYYGDGNRRLVATEAGAEVCTEEIHLHEFLEDFPTSSIKECVANVHCSSPSLALNREMVESDIPS